MAKPNDRAKYLTAIACAVYEAVEAMGDQGIPSGHVYASLMGTINIDDYNIIIGVLKKTNKIKESHFLLTAIK